jgi:hypothetical protein
MTKRASIQDTTIKALTPQLERSHAPCAHFAARQISGFGWL